MFLKSIPKTTCSDPETDIERWESGAADFYLFILSGLSALRSGMKVLRFVTRERPLLVSHGDMMTKVAAGRPCVRVIRVDRCG